MLNQNEQSRLAGGFLQWPMYGVSMLEFDSNSEDIKKCLGPRYINGCREFRISNVLNIKYERNKHSETKF